MRNDFKNDKNSGEKDKLWAYKRMLERNGIELFEKIKQEQRSVIVYEKMFNIKFTKFQKRYFNRFIKRNNKQ